MQVLWPALDGLRAIKEPGVPQKIQLASLEVHVSNTRSSILKQNVQEGNVVATRTLTADGEPAKKHVEIRLPSGMTYRAGDYLTVLPINPKETVQRAMRRFELPVKSPSLVISLWLSNFLNQTF